MAEDRRPYHKPWRRREEAQSEGVGGSLLGGGLEGCWWEKAPSWAPGGTGVGGSS